MRKLIFYLSIFFAFILPACRPAAKPVSVSNKPVSINEVQQTNVPLPPSKPLVEMTWTLSGGGEQKLKDLAGKVVILDFWATNCPPCRAEIPHLRSLIEKHGPDKIAIVGLHVGDDEDRTLIPQFAKETQLDYPIAFPEPELTRFVFAERNDIPQTMVLDKSGKFVKKFVGFGTQIALDLDAAVEQAMNRD